MADLERQLRSYARVLDEVSLRRKERGPEIRRLDDSGVARHRPWRSRRAVLAGSVAAAVALGLIISLLVLPQRRKIHELSATVPGSVVLVGTLETSSFDPATGSNRSLDLTEQLPGDSPYAMVLVGDDLIYRSRCGATCSAVSAFSLGTGRTKVVGRADWFVPGGDGSSVWLVNRLDTVGNHSSVQRVVPSTGEKDPVLSLPAKWTADVGAIGDELPLHGLYANSTDFVLWNTTTKQVDRRLGGGLSFVGEGAGSIVFGTGCPDRANPIRCAGLRVIEVKSGRSRTLGRPPAPGKGWVFSGTLESALSPDGRSLAIRAAIAGPVCCQPELVRTRVAVIDLASGDSSWVPRSDAAPYSRVAWSSDGKWVLFETTAGTLGAYRPSDKVLRVFTKSLSDNIAIVAAPEATRHATAAPATTSNFGSCPTDMPLPPGPNAKQEAIAAARRAEPKVYMDPVGYKGSASLHRVYEVTGAAGPYPTAGLGAIARTMCGNLVATRTWFVFLRFPEINAASAGNGQLFLSRFGDGWKAWYAYH